MKKIITIYIFILAMGAYADCSIKQYSETKRVFNTLQSLEGDQFPGLVEFSFGEKFPLPEFREQECRTVSSRGILRLLSDYVDSLNEVGLGEFDAILFKKQMGLILGSRKYESCVTKSFVKGLERVDSYILSVDGGYQLWLTEVYLD